MTERKCAFCDEQAVAQYDRCYYCDEHEFDAYMAKG
jgi:hypothetical protein